MKGRLSSVVVVFLFVLSGCGKMLHPEDVEREADYGEDVCVRFSLEVSDVSENTRSSVSAEDSYISSINIFAYCDGHLENAVFANGSQPVSLSLPSGKTYNIYAIANVGEIDAPLEESGLSAYRQQVSLEGYRRYGFPMAVSDRITLTGRDVSKTLALVRLVAKIKFNVDAYAIPGFKVRSVALKNTPVDVLPFSNGSMAQKTGDGDVATSDDIDRLNSGGTAVFYMAENCQGVLLPDNDDQWQKVPDNLAPEKRDLCTYVEVSAVLDGSSGLEGPATYRFYLGQDVVSDFNIYRNTENTVTLVATENGLDRVSWRIDSKELSLVMPPVVIVGSGNLIVHTDEDGNLRRQSVGSNNWSAVAYGDGKYLAVGGNNSNVAYSADGISWENKWGGVSRQVSLAYGNGNFVSCNGMDNTLSYSSDGLSWNTIQVGSVAWNDIEYMNGYFLLAGSRGHLALSSDCINWTVSKVSDTDWKILLCQGWQFIAVGKGSIAISSGLVGWSVYSLSGLDFVDADYGNDRFVAIGKSGETYTAMYATSWEKHPGSLKQNTYSKLMYMENMFVAVGREGAVAYSKDGITWTERNVGVTDQDLNDLCLMQ